MALLTPDGIHDLVNNTTRKFHRHKWVDISMDLQRYIAGEFIKKDRIIEQGGEQIQWQLQVSNTGTSVDSGLYAEDQTAVDDVTQEAHVPWRKLTTSWSYDVDEPLFQSDRETIVDMLLIREHSAMNLEHEKNERDLWSAPTGSSDKRVMGVPFWIQKDASTTPGGAFNGGNPSGFSGGCAGVSSTDYPNYRNWTFGYSAVTPDDLVVKLKRAFEYTNFVASDPHPTLGFGGVDFTIYTVYDGVVEPLERLAESRNDNLGPDVAKYLNRVAVGGVPIRSVPYLTANDTSCPLYGINKRVFRPFLKRGADHRRTIKDAPRQHTVKNVFYDTWRNFMCIDRRQCFVGSKA